MVNADKPRAFTLDDRYNPNRGHKKRYDWYRYGRGGEHSTHSHKYPVVASYP